MANNLHEKLLEVQKELKAPKGQFNSFGKYYYRSAEDILEAVKPLLHERQLLLNISDEVNSVGDRVYVVSTVTVTDGTDKVTATASAREAVNKKGMDDSQITGATSSYARKYALNGMFAIDDNKDSDATNKHDQDAPQVQKKKNYDGGATDKQKRLIKDKLSEMNVTDDEMKEFVDFTTGDTALTVDDASNLIDMLLNDPDSVKEDIGKFRRERMGVE